MKYPDQTRAWYEIHPLQLLVSLHCDRPPACTSAATVQDAWRIVPAFHMRHLRTSEKPPIQRTLDPIRFDFEAGYLLLQVATLDHFGIPL
jgi:hypothetical protein